jgi:hypothetical protein
MEPSVYDETPLYNTLYFVRGTKLLAEINQMATHNRSENRRGAWVALCAHPIILILILIILN